MIDCNHLIFNEDMERIFNSRHSWKEFDNATLLVTGGTGMLASYLIYFFIWLRENRGLNLRLVINVRNIGKINSVFGEKINQKWITILCCDVNQLEETQLCSLKINYVIHAASYASADKYGKYPVETIEPNVIATKKLLDICRCCNAKMLYFSSTAIYGNTYGRTVLTEDENSIMDLKSNGNYYAISKYCGEALCKAYSLEYGVSVVTVRIAHTYGPTMDIDNDVRVFAEFVKAVIYDEPIIIKSDGKARRFFCYISDAISGMMLALLDGKSGESYNLGNPEENYSVAELAEIMDKLRVTKNNGIQYGERQSCEYTPASCVSEAIICVDKLKGLGWENRISAREGFYRTVQLIKDSLQWNEGTKGEDRFN